MTDVLAETRAHLAMRNSDLAEAVRLLDALLGLEKGSGEEAMQFVERYRAAVSSPSERGNAP